MQTQDMDDFDTPARRGQSRDKGKGKAHAAEPGRHSVSGRPGAIYMDDVSYEELTFLLRFVLYDVLTSYNRRVRTTSTYQPDVESLAIRGRLLRPRPTDVETRLPCYGAAETSSTHR